MTKKVEWRGKCQQELAALPTGVREAFVAKLEYLKAGLTPSGLHPWGGIGPGGKELKSGGCRMVICLEFDTIYALHAFRKSGGRGKKTSKKFQGTVDARYRALCAELAAKNQRQ